MWARPRPDAIPEHLDSIPQRRGRPVCDGPRRGSLWRRTEKWDRGKCAWTARERPQHYLVRHMVEIPASLVSRSRSSCAGVALAMSKQVLLRQDRPELLAWLTAVFRQKFYSSTPFLSTFQLLIHTSFMFCGVTGVQGTSERSTADLIHQWCPALLQAVPKYVALLLCHSICCPVDSVPTHGVKPYFQSLQNIFKAF